MSELFRPVHLDGKTYRLTKVSEGSCRECAFDANEDRCIQANRQQRCVVWNSDQSAVSLDLVFKEVTS